MRKSDTSTAIPEITSLSPNEAQLLSLIRSGEYHTIKIRIKERGILSLDLVQTRETRSKLVDLIRKSPFQDLTVKTHQGKVTHIEQTTKLVLK